MRNFTENARTERVLNAVAAGTDDTQYSDIVDTNGFDSVVFELLLGSITATGTVAVTLQAGSESDGSDAADITGSGVSASDGDDNGVIQSEAYRPEARYVRLKIVRATANVAIDGAIAILRDPKRMPVTISDDVVANELVLQA